MADEAPKSRFENVKPEDCVDVLAQEVNRSKLAPTLPCKVGFVGLLFDHDAETINLMVLNPSLNPDVIYSQLHDLANGIKQQMRTMISQQQQGRIAVPGAPPPGSNKLQ